MMKKLISFIVAMIALVASVHAEQLTYSEVIQVEGKNQAEIFGGLREWVSTYYHNGKAVTQMEDPATGVILLKAALPYNKGGFLSAYEGYLNYNLRIQVKDGRYKVEMSNIFHENKPGRAKDCSLGLLTTDEKCDKGGINKATHGKIWKDLKKVSAEDFTSIVNSLKGWKNFNAAAEEDW